MVLQVSSQMIFLQLLNGQKQKNKQMVRCTKDEYTYT